MTFSNLVDVSIGLMLLYFLLSLLCTTLNELIQTALRLRAKSLSDAISQLIDDGTLLEAFRAHGLIRSLELAARGGKDVTGDQPRMSYLDSRSFASALLQSLDKFRANAESMPHFADIEKVVRDLPESRIRDVLLASMTDAKSDLDIVKANLALWFDSAMDRLSGHYKRRMQTISLVIGLLIALGLNADSLHVLQSLWRDQALRTEVLNVAVDTIAKGRDTARCSEEAQKATPPLTSDQIRAEATCLVKQASDAVSDAHVFPIGWSAKDWSEASAGGWRGAAWALVKTFGILWTAAALALGATFWFDMLQKIIGLRGAGPKPASLSGAKASAR